MLSGSTNEYGIKQNELKNSNLAKKFVELRNESQKTGIRRIASASFYRDSEGNRRAKHYFEDANNVYSKGEDRYRM